jgi:hypothetical protein
VLLYRVFPYLNRSAKGEPGHPLYTPAVQGGGRWDNPGLYVCRYLATTPEAAVGEAFGHLATWSAGMLISPSLNDAARSLGIYRLDEDLSPILDLDDPEVLAERGIRPTHVVVRNRPRTQAIAARIYREGRWAGIQWWSFYRPQWPVVALWEGDLTVERVENLAPHPALDDAARELAKLRSGI